MFMYRFIIPSLLMLAVVSCLGGCAKQPDFAVGQVWEYRARPVDADSRIRIDNIETRQDIGKVIYISIIGVEIFQKLPNTNRRITITNFPITEKKLRTSVHSLSSNPLPANTFEDYSVDTSSMANTTIRNNTVDGIVSEMDAIGP